MNAFALLSDDKPHSLIKCNKYFFILFVFSKVRNSNKIVLKIVLVIVNINKDENKSLISNQFSLKKVNR
jgi:hypothetical protein